MWIDIIQWVGIALSCYAIGINIWSAVRSHRMFKQYMDARQKLAEAAEEYYDLIYEIKKNKE